LWLGYHHTTHLWTIYSVLFLIGTGRTFSGPASSAFVPHLVPKEEFVNAVTWGANVFQTANIVGPALGGLMLTLNAPFGLTGPPLVYLISLCSLFVFLYLVGSLHIRIGRLEHGDFSLKLVLAGFRYVWRAKMVLGAITLDLAAVLLGGCTALMPIFAQDILHTCAPRLQSARSSFPSPSPGFRSSAKPAARCFSASSSSARPLSCSASRAACGSRPSPCCSTADPT